MKASFLVSLKIAKCGKPHTIGKELLLPATKDIVTCMFGESSAKQQDIISLSNNTVCHSIENMALNVKENVITQVKNKDFFVIRLDENTDIINYAQLVTYGLHMVCI